MRSSKYLWVLAIGLFTSTLYAEGMPESTPPTTPVQAEPVASPPPAPPANTYGGVSPTGLGASQSKGRMRLSGTLGFGQAYGDDYTILGLGAGYYWWRGLETGVDFEGWFGGGPNIYKISPEARYMFREFPGPIKPYAGGFYRHTFYEEDPDLDSVGGRFGGVLASRGGTSLGAGAVYEHFAGCNERVYGKCDMWYPEFTFFFSF